MDFDSQTLIGLALAAYAGFLLGRWTAQASRLTRAERRANQRRHIAAVVSGLDPKLTKQVRGLIGERRTIEAVRLLRAELGLGLKESKDVVDALRQRPGA